MIVRKKSFGRPKKKFYSCPKKNLMVVRGSSKLRISEFFGFQWQNLTEILRLLPKVLRSYAFFQRLQVQWLTMACQKRVKVFSFSWLDKVLPESGSLAFFVVNLLMLQLRFFCCCRECRIYALFFVANVVNTRFLG